MQSAIAKQPGELRYLQLPPVAFRIRPSLAPPTVDQRKAGQRYRLAKNDQRGEWMLVVPHLLDQRYGIGERERRARRDVVVAIVQKAGL